MSTFFSEGALQSREALMVAGVVGTIFGFVLERAGFGSSRKLVSIFYLRDFAVFKVMFTAIVVAMLGARGLEQVGLVNLESWYQLETFLVPQTVAGLVFGAGFVMGGWCPGTAVVGCATGRSDALVFLGGVAGGSVVYALVYPAIEGFATQGGGVSTLPGVLGISPALLSVLVALLAVGLFIGADRLAAWKATRAALEAVPS
ncbi:MAG: YeeE/YedE thiosulfate transporter family protein [Myxococcales bacterium]|nr:YeeE/YedE thiosulfate transporter family protein [Myxococcales bacterium]